MVGIIDAGGIVRYANTKWSTDTGPFDELGVTCPGPLVDPEDVAGTAALLAALGTTAEARCELRLRRADGSFRRYGARISALDGGDDEPLWLVTCTELSVDRATIAGLGELATRIARSAEDARVQAARSLDEARQLLATVEQRARVGHFQYDRGLDAFEWSAEVYNIVGLRPSGTLTMASLLATYHRDDRYRAMTIIRQALDDGQAFTFSARVVRPDGAIRRSSPRVACSVSRVSRSRGSSASFKM